MSNVGDEFRPGYDPHAEQNEWPWDVGRPVACTHAAPDVCAVMWQRQMQAARRLSQTIRLNIGGH